MSYWVKGPGNTFTLKYKLMRSLQTFCRSIIMMADILRISLLIFIIYIYTHAAVLSILSIICWLSYLGSCLQLTANCHAGCWNSSGKCVELYSRSMCNSSAVTIYYWWVGPRVRCCTCSVRSTVDSTLSSCTQSFHTDPSSCQLQAVPASILPWYAFIHELSSYVMNCEDRNIWRTVRRDCHKPASQADNWRRCLTQIKCQVIWVAKKFSDTVVGTSLPLLMPNDTHGNYASPEPVKEVVLLIKINHADGEWVLEALLCLFNGKFSIK